ncbi:MULTISPECIES: sulfotransferase family protein [Micromonospora]|uniref:sulfotransferase family protein n=1 Tax=Micromonospora TaxID=1873 RepID=UPI001EE7DAA4|nr:sulfotransferase [Micromonospora hortensis]MCG5450564.1 sulfotransferase domain-containing protein [Micromonospora hortensis]WTI10731.1 sulfotransferase domain-containing protein [Micromonospora sp. NBC_00821]
MTGIVRRQVTDRLRRGVRAARAWGRAARPGEPGPLPDFLVIGGQRCGTTSLYHHLAAHPQVRVASGKELQYFSVHHGRGVRWYRGHFPRLAPGERTFEASPYYLFHPSVPARVAATLPQARFVVLLRDPVQRAYSHYLHTRSYGVEPLSFADALDAEEERLDRATRGGPDSAAAHRALRNYSYAARGCYAEQLDRWFAQVPRERIHVARTEDLHTDPAGTYGDMLRFLGLPAFTPEAFTRHTRRVDNGVSQLTPALRERLDAYFAPHNARLSALLDWPDPWPAR